MSRKNMILFTLLSFYQLRSIKCSISSRAIFECNVAFHWIEIEFFHNCGWWPNFARTHTPTHFYVRISVSHFEHPDNRTNHIMMKILFRFANAAGQTTKNEHKELYMNGHLQLLGKKIDYFWILTIDDTECGQNVRHTFCRRCQCQPQWTQ